MSVKIRFAAPGDRDLVIALLSHLHGDAAVRRYEWLYLRNPHGPALTWLAIEESSGAAVGITSVFPRLLFVGGNTCVGSVGGDCYVLPSARGKGIATRLHVATRQDMGQRGVKVMYGPPLPINLRALLSAGATVVTEFRRFTLLLRPSSRASDGAEGLEWNRFRGVVPSAVGLAARLMAAACVPRDLSEYSITRVTHFTEEWDPWAEVQRWSYPVSCVRDRRYLNWRYVESPERRHIPYAIRRRDQLVGLLVLREERPRCAVVDLFAGRSRSTLIAALALGARKAEAAGCGALDVWCTPFPGHRRVLGGLGFIRRDRRREWLFQVLSADGQVTNPLLLGRRNWYFAYGDQDVD
jgi:GNAT superfamily N-acetyltransferase